MEDELAIFFIFGGGAAFLLAISPIGRAIADRIRGRSVGGGADERVRYLQETHDSLLEEVDGMRREIGDLQERVDFTERLMARDQDKWRLKDGSDVQD
ncbi:MAG: hypothetical protein O7I93_05515 [Gemmatimonadetes bacterium]|nr:hypothetical protein [Gemmatimonadota bacterium]